MSELQKFDPAQLMNGVRDRIKSTFVSLIPDEQWEAMIQKEVEMFFQSTESYYSSNRHNASPFQLLCRQVFHDITAERLRDHMSEFTSDTWDSHGPKLNEALKAMLIESAPELMVSIMRTQFQNAVNNMRNS